MADIINYTVFSNLNVILFAAVNVAMLIGAYVSVTTADQKDIGPMAFFITLVCFCLSVGMYVYATDCHNGILFDAKNRDHMWISSDTRDTAIYAMRDRKVKKIIYEDLPKPEKEPGHDEQNTGSN